MAFAQLQNHEYDNALASGRAAHAGEHKNFAIVHVVMAYALEAKSELQQAQREYETFVSVKEDPSNPRAAPAKTRAAELAAQFGGAPKQ